MLRYLASANDMLKLRMLGSCRVQSAGRPRRPVTPDAPAMIIGALMTASGISNGARLMIRDFRRRNVPCHAVDVTGLLGMTAVEPDESYSRHTDHLPLLPRIIHLNPPHFGRTLYGLRHTVFKAPVVGYWAWELETAPQKWTASARLTDEIWVPSPFVRDAMLNMLDGVDDAPVVRVVPHAIAESPPIDRNASAQHRARLMLGLPPQGFVAGFTFSVLAGVRRKNPEAAIAAFRKAFPSGEADPILLLRCADAAKNRTAWASLLQMAAQDPRIRLVEPAVCPIQDFFSAIDTLLSLHRSEGYGLTLAEAVRAGIPVIATSWNISDEISGSKLFHPVPSVLIPVEDPAGPYREFHNLRWAEPDVGIAAQHLRELQAIHRYHIVNG